MVASQMVVLSKYLVVIIHLTFLLNGVQIPYKMISLENSGFTNGSVSVKSAICALLLPKLNEKNVAISQIFKGKIYQPPNDNSQTAYVCFQQLIRNRAAAFMLFGCSLMKFEITHY